MRTKEDEALPVAVTEARKAQRTLQLVPAEARSTRLAIIDDDEAVRVYLDEYLRGLGFDVATFSAAEDALEVLKSARAKTKPHEPFDLIFCDVRMPGMDGLQMTGEVKTLFPEIPIVLVTAFADVEQAVESIRIGAFDYLEKPLNLGRLEIVVRNALVARQLRVENASFRRAATQGLKYEGVICSSPSMQAIYELVLRLSHGDSTVLVRGESGVGKELIARAVHDNSRRSEKPFVSVNCSAIPESLLESELFGHSKGAFSGAVSERKGLFEEAHGGTLFLDEIGDLNLSLQAKLLRVLQDKKIRAVGSNQLRSVDVRIVTATHKNLEEEVRAGSFREDLYYRLNVIPIHIPPLRQRRDDIPALVDYFLKKSTADNHRSVRGLTEDAMKKLCTMRLKGNVRELQNVVERSVVLSTGHWIDAGDIPTNENPELDDFDLSPDADGRLPSLQDIERRYIQSVLKRFGGRKLTASRALGVSRRTLYRKLDEMATEPPDEAPNSH